MNLFRPDCRENKLKTQQHESLVPDMGEGSTLNQHELTNRYRRLAAEVGMPACVEQQTIAEWLSSYDSTEVTY